MRGKRFIFVPSILFNLQWLLEELVGSGAGAMLGVQWSFQTFDPQAPALAEFELPIPWKGLAARMARHSGVLLEAHRSDVDGESYERLAFGQPVVVAVDSFHLPHRPAYGRVHSARTLILLSLDEPTRSVEVMDTWPPAYVGKVPVAAIQRARATQVTHDPIREPLFADTQIEGQWWTVALSGDASIATAEGLIELLRELVSEDKRSNGGVASADAMERFREDVAAVLREPLRSSHGQRRAAALHLRAEVGTRAFLLEAMRLAARVLEDDLLEVETERWAKHLDELARARDILIKSIMFDRRQYATLVEDCLRRGVRYERHYAAVTRELFGGAHDVTQFESSATC